MAISSVSELRTAITNWVDREDLSSDRVNEFIALAEARIARRLRVRGVEERSTTPLVGGQQYYALPSDFLQARNVQINTNPVRVLKYLTPQQMDKRWPSADTGTTLNFTIIGEEIQLAPVPGSVDNMEVAYYKRLPALTDSATTNWLTTNAPDMLLYASLIEAETYLVNPEKAATYAAMLDVAMREWDVQENKGRHSGSALQISNASGNP